MQYVPNADPPAPAPGPQRDFYFLIEPEPWPLVFLRNVADLFHPAPPQVWLTSRPAEYWPDALVDRPAPWLAIGESFLVHTLAAVAIYSLPLLWLNLPHTVAENLSATHA